MKFGMMMMGGLRGVASSKNFGELWSIFSVSTIFFIVLRAQRRDHIPLGISSLIEHLHVAFVPRRGRLLAVVLGVLARPGDPRRRRHQRVDESRHLVDVGRVLAQSLVVVRVAEDQKDVRPRTGPVLAEQERLGRVGSARLDATRRRTLTACPRRVVLYSVIRTRPLTFWFRDQFDRSFGHYGWL